MRVQRLWRPTSHCTQPLCRLPRVIVRVTWSHYHTGSLRMSHRVIVWGYVVTVKSHKVIVRACIHCTGHRVIVKVTHSDCEDTLSHCDGIQSHCEGTQNHYEGHRESLWGHTESLSGNTESFGKLFWGFVRGHRVLMRAHESLWGCAVIVKVTQPHFDASESHWGHTAIIVTHLSL